MITAWIMEAFGAFIEWFLGFFSFDPPEWLEDFPGYVDEFTGYMASLGAWINFSAIGAALVGLLACIVLAATVRGTRIIASFLTFGGGQ